MQPQPREKLTYRVVPHWAGLVSLVVMRLPVRFFASLAVVVCAGICAQAQSAPAPAQSSSTQGVPAPGTDTQTPGNNGAYVSIDPLAGVRYDNRYDLSLGMAYAHIKAGPILLQGANLGGLDLTGSYWFSKHWAVEGTGRGYFGTSGAAPNSLNIMGPVVSQYLFAAGPEWLGPHNKHGALIAHVLVGGAYGDFEHDLDGNPPSTVGFYNNQVAPAALFGGHFDLNRSARWVFRITPDAIFTRYSSDYGTNITPSGGRTNWNFGLSVGAEYKFKKKR